MPLAAPKFFSADPADARSLAGLDLVTLFNEEILPLVNRLGQNGLGLDDPLDDGLDGLEERAQEREARARRDRARDIFSSQQDDEFLSNLRGGEAGAGRLPGGGLPASSSSSSGEHPSSRSTGGGAVPQDLTAFVKHFEGYNPNAFGDYKQTSIGYGTRAKPGEKEISRGEAEQRLASELSRHRGRVLAHAKRHGYNFAPNQLDALTSFDFNTGRLEQLTAGGSRSPDEIARAIPLYRKAGGKVLGGLVRRRAAERKLFEGGS